MLETQTAFVMFQINKTILLRIHLHASSWNPQKYHKHSKQLTTAHSLLTIMVQGTMGMRWPNM